MNLLERIAKWFGVDAPPQPNPRVIELREKLEAGRLCKRREAYDDAMAHFDEAIAIAQSMHDTSAVEIIQLLQVDLLLRLERTEEINAKLDDMEATAIARHHHAQIAYIFIARGQLAEYESRWQDAQSHYEKAVEYAQEHHIMSAEARAQGHLADIYLRNKNASYANHLFRKILPVINAVGDLEINSYFIGRLGEAEIAQGNDVEGYQLVTRALKLADQLHFRPHQRRWHQVLAQKAMADNRLEDAHDHYLQTWRMIHTKAQNKPSSIKILRQLTLVCLQLRRYEDALIYGERTINTEPDEPESNGLWAIVLHETGRSEESLAYFEKALHDKQQARDSELTRIYAAAIAETGDIERAHATFQQALEIARVNEDQLEIARANRDMGMLYSRRNQFEQAISAFSEAVTLYEDLNYHAQVARLYCDIANLRNMLGQGLRAGKDYEHALMKLSMANDPATRGIVLSNASSIYFERGDLTTAESFVTESIQIAQKLNDTVAEATRQGNFGWFLLTSGRYKRAISALEYAINQSTRLGLDLQLGVQKTNLARVYVQIGEIERGIVLHREALALLETTSSQYWQAIALNNLINSLIDTGEEENIAEAQSLFDSVEQTAQALPHVDLKIRTDLTCLRLAMCDDEADLIALKARIEHAVNTARRSHTNRLLGKALLTYSQWSAKTGDRQHAEKYWQEAKTIINKTQYNADLSLPAWLETVEDNTTEDVAH